MPRTLLSRSLEPLAASLWGLLLGWSLLLGAVWIGALDESHLRDLLIRHEWKDPGLQGALIFLASSVVPAWLALALANSHLALSRSEGSSTARRWLWWLVGGALAIGLLAQWLSLPWARINFLDALGRKLLGVPIGWILLWPMLVVGGRELVLWLRPRASHTFTVLAGAALVVLSFANIEPLAPGGGWRWWFWYAGSFTTHAAPPWMAFALFAAVFGWLLRETHLRPQTLRRSRKPAVAFLIFNGLLLAAHVRLWLLPPEVLSIELP